MQQHSDPNAHDQHKNEIEDFLDGLRAFWSKYGMSTLVLILTVLVVILMPRYISGREQRALDEAYTALAEAQSPFALTDVADRYRHIPGFSSYALLRAAQLRARDALGLAQLAPDEQAPTEQDRRAGLEQAAELYHRVIKEGHSTLLVLNARLGLAGVLESLDRFDEAAEQYAAIIDSAGEQWPIHTQRADARAKSLDDLKTPITFPEPKPDASAADASGAAEIILPPSTELLPDIDLSSEPLTEPKPETEPLPAPPAADSP